MYSKKYCSAEIIDFSEAEAGDPAPEQWFGSGLEALLFDDQGRRYRSCGKLHIWTDRYSGIPPFLFIIFVILKIKEGAMSSASLVELNPKVKDRLDYLKLHPEESYSDVIDRLASFALDEGALIIYVVDVGDRGMVHRNY